MFKPIEGSRSIPKTKKKSKKYTEEEINEVLERIEIEDVGNGYSKLKMKEVKNYEQN